LPMSLFKTFLSGLVIFLNSPINFLVNDVGRLKGIPENP